MHGEGAFFSEVPIFNLVPRLSLPPVFDCLQCAQNGGRRPGEFYHVIPSTHDVTGSRRENIFTFISPATEKLEKQDNFQPRDKFYI